ncbi:Hypothetical predicted protein [Paramuricea clavata]|uniref:Uncharacterized protein n=1 Tax=Paramuricea clavata TaxID=317549 RepID=A0A6S7FZS5_PARCT|nr:Hypothetical predicted protein [Paramuricea clavata]
MSNYETDSEDSYQSDDSDINFIPGYIMENSELVKNSDDDSSVEELNMGLAYADEPLADEEWLANYNRQEKERLEIEEKLCKRLDGSVQLSEWCKCGNCGVELLTNGNECYCCCELEGCEEAMNREEVIKDLEVEGVQNAKCVTQHPGFNPVCLQKWSLKQASDRYKTKNKDKYKQIKTQERFLRSISYREFTRLIYGFLGNRRIPLPSCAYTAIRKTFPIDKEEHFVGYSDDSD